MDRLQQEIITFDGVHKTFKTFQRPHDRLKETLFGRPCHTAHHVLNGISFSVAPGETVGLVGRNGAGKSTLLKLVMGVLLPDAGRITVAGKVTGLLELGSGFNPQLSGRDNILFNGLLLGLTPPEIEERKEKIIQFAELGSYIDSPVKTFSSGMFMRLAFAIAIHADPQCFIVDEALAVGDVYFQQKCMRKINEFRDAGGSILFVSHDLNGVKTLCNRAILIENGAIVMQGEPKVVVDYFEGTVLQDLHQGQSDVAVDRSVGTATTTTGEVNLEWIKLQDDLGKEMHSVISEEAVTISFAITANRDIASPHYGIAIRDRYGRSTFETNTYCMGQSPAPLTVGGDQTTVSFRFICNLAPGDYSVSIGVANHGFDRGSFKEYLLVRHEALVLRVLINEEAIIYAGITNLDPICSLSHAPLG